MRFLLVLLLCSVAACKRPPESSSVGEPLPAPIAGLEEGDIVFQKLPCGSLCEAIIETTPCADGLAFNHCGVFRYEAGRPMIVEAIGATVRQTPLAAFLQRDSSAMLVAGRVNSVATATAAAQRSTRYLGRPYDDAFLPGDSALYCSELVWEAYRTFDSSLFTLRPMTFRSGGRTHPGWVAYYTGLNQPIPEGELGINPCAMAANPAVRLIRLSKSALVPVPATP